ncbi:MAG: LysR family transcriptional regulator, partial [Pseudomonadota bacterium]
MANWEGVSEFVAVAETNSFTGAANKLKTSVAQISRRVSALEERLAVKLLHRTTRKVSLTEAGQLYYQQCKHLVEGLELAELAVTQMQAEPKGLLKVTAPVTYGEMNLAPLLHQFIEKYPQVNLDLNLTNQKLDLIEQGVDVAIRLGRLQDSSLIAKRLSSRQLYVCASPAYLDRSGEPHTLSELSHHQCLVGTADYWHFKEQKREKSLRVSGRIKCNSGFALVDAAKRGLGLVQLPD